MHPSNVSRILDSIQPESFPSDTERHEAMEAARRLLARLQTPFEHMFSLTGTIPLHTAGLEVFHNLGIWRNWTKRCNETGNTPQRFDKILAMAEAPVEPNLLRRFLRHLSASNTLTETNVDEWKLTPFTRELGDENTSIGKGFPYGAFMISAATNLAPFLAKHNYKEPLDAAEFDNHADVFGDVFFKYLQENSSAGTRFQSYMTATRDYKMDWTEVYDTNKLLRDEAGDLLDLTESTPPFFVDIGGMHGLDTLRLLSRHPELPNHIKLVVQDLPGVVAAYAEQQLDPQGRISRMAYDFFTPQPLVGARAYFFHAVPHDWPDAELFKILENVKAVMERGYSKLLLYEMVIPAKGASAVQTTLDLALMSVCSGLERTEEQWKSLLDAAGLRIVSISRHPRAAESVIEVELP